MNDKETPMKPSRYFFNASLYKCGRCRKVLDVVEHEYCPQCGQRIDWSDYQIHDEKRRGRG